MKQIKQSEAHQFNYLKYIFRGCLDYNILEHKKKLF